MNATNGTSGQRENLREEEQKSGNNISKFVYCVFIQALFRQGKCWSLKSRNLEIFDSSGGETGLYCGLKGTTGGGTRYKRG